MAEWTTLLCTDQGEDAAAVLQMLQEENISYQTKMVKGSLHVLVHKEQYDSLSHLASSHLQLQQAEQEFNTKLARSGRMLKMMRLLFPGWN
jgi:hypothetical protein